MIKKAHGFTVVELIIVIAVIAILAALAMVSYRGIQKGARDAVLKSDLEQTANIVASWLARPDNNIEQLFQIFQTSGSASMAYIEGSETKNSLAPTALRWNTVAELPKIQVNKYTTMEVIAKQGRPAPFTAQLDENNAYMAQHNGFCLTAVAPGSTYDYLTGAGIQAQYNKILFYDSMVGGIRTLSEITAAYDRGERSACLMHVLMYRHATS
jgi:prepilin-type N-terminal cleavage/methylation domain-containing protein